MKSALFSTGLSSRAWDRDGQCCFASNHNQGWFFTTNMRSVSFAADVSTHVYMQENGQIRMMLFFVIGNDCSYCWAERVLR